MIKQLQTVVDKLNQMDSNFDVLTLDKLVKMFNDVDLLIIPANKLNNVPSSGTKTKITEKEMAILVAVVENEYSENNPTRPVWSSVICGTHSAAGTLANLVKKGLVKREGQGPDSICFLTADGIAVYERIKQNRTNQKS